MLIGEQTKTSPQGLHMNIHKNAQLTPRGRLAMVRRVCIGQPFGAVAQSFDVSARSVRKWVVRYRAEGYQKRWSAAIRRR